MPSGAVSISATVFLVKSSGSEEMACTLRFCI
ncbi:MAG: hypothetical protein EGR26_06110 [Clostridiales bacterium]|nr:hypothetical protein [Clostridiales bacterium]